MGKQKRRHVRGEHCSYDVGNAVTHEERMYNALWPSCPLGAIVADPSPLRYDRGEPLHVGRECVGPVGYLVYSGETAGLTDRGVGGCEEM